MFTMHVNVVDHDFLLFFFSVFFFLVYKVGYPAKALPDFFGTSNRAMEEEVSKKVDQYIQMLLQTAERCEHEGVRTYIPSTIALLLA